MNKALAFAALAEATTGLALMAAPTLVAQLLFGAELNGVASVIGRVTGIALLALGIACWPSFTALCGMLTYSMLATAYLLFVALRGEWGGPVLWPAVVLHAVLTLLLARAWMAARTASASNALE
jgi:hypothetical protein